MAYLNVNGLRKVYSRLKLIFLEKGSVVNNLTTTEEGLALDARQGRALKTLVDGKAAAVQAAAALSQSGWTASGSVYTQTVSVSGVTAAGTVLVSPAPGSFVEYCGAQVYASAQAAGKLTFTAVYQPQTALDVNCLIVE